ncbi:AzlC family ABC transporter permease [Halodesulfovibrio marinisediminis]|uniref:4-azaleucine resistance probable transporter AzlC n=1 Tax=Halodesulfovibrio marinisediminis DSM 17456 TaxID=1121457 RepID=A0A1N6J6B5_9BACT|nr:AzlC family ABC transporter permease [Halodesulfovibrio marinisediminis]SIO39850.1 4-azaleucine resistance probable transporter AzlC [Halodesulfovibrio marinisediminis DSM 17456]
MSKSRSTKESFFTGAGTIIPVMPGIVPFGMLTGVVTIATGISPLKAIFMTFFMFAGAAQVSVAQLMSEHSSAIIIVATAIMINLRFVMYSASITPYLGPLRPWQRLYLSYTLSDQAYAVSIVEFTKKDSPYQKLPFFFGACTSLYVTWMVSTISGIFFGALIPPEWSFDFAVPLTFLALLAPNITDRPSALAAAVAATVAILSVSLPYNMGLMSGAFAGIFTGYFVSKRKRVCHEQ